MVNKRVGIILHALMGSTRLKKKPIRLLCGREMIAHQIDRLKTAKIPETIILSTSKDKEDQVLLDIAKREGIESFAGPKEDLAERLLQTAEKFSLDFIIAPSGDNPLVDAEHIDVLAKDLINEDYDYADGVNILPIGLFAKGIKTTALRKVCEIKDEKDTGAYMVYFVKMKGLFKTGKIKALSWIEGSDARLTVDTPEDFELLEKIFDEFYMPGEVFSIAEVLLYLKRYPQIKEINSDIVQLPLNHFPFRIKKEYEKYKFNKV